MKEFNLYIFSLIFCFIYIIFLILIIYCLDEEEEVREATKKYFFFKVAQPLRGEGGIRAWPLRKKTCFEAQKRNFEKKLEVGGGRALVVGPQKKILFCGFP